MSEVVLRHPDLPKQPIVVPVGSDGSVSAEWAESGWALDLDTDPVKARLERPDPKEDAEPVTPHFASAPDVEPVSAPSVAIPETPADSQPVTDEQGSSSLDLTKEK